MATAMSDVLFNCTKCNDPGESKDMFIIGTKLLCRKCVKEHTPYPFCHQPSKCLSQGRCVAIPNCCE